MEFHSEDLLTVENNGHRWTRGNLSKPSRHAGHVTIDMLPDEVLLKIFALYLEEDNFYLMGLSIAAWHTLVHVCRTWRIVVFGSPRRLDLRLQCGTGRKRASAREMLDTFPLLPIVLQQYDDRTWDMDNIMAALEHKDRLCEITLRDASISPVEKVLAAMQEPFPALTNLQLHLNSAMTQVIPNSFLGGSAPHLQELTLHHIAFPGLRKLLSSTTHLVKLDLQRVPRSGYISPEAMVTCLSTLTSLEGLRLGFQFRESRNPPPLTRSVLPALIHFGFKGFSEYLEDFVARIDTPMLYGLEITFFHQPIFDTPDLSQFIGRTPNLKARDTAGVLVADSGVWLVPEWPEEPYAGVGVEVPYSQSGWPSPFAHVCRSSFPHHFISSLENLYIRVHDYQLPWQEDPENQQENPQWLELLHPFTTVKNLYLPKEVISHIVPALQELVGERVVELLPALQGLFLEEANPAGPVQEVIVQFVAARQLFGHPITVSHWDRE